MNEKIIYALLAITFIGLLASFASSPPGTPPRPCLDEQAIRQRQNKVAELKKTLHECQAHITNNQQAVSDLQTLKEQVEQCRLRIEGHRKQLKQLSDHKSIVCDEEMCLQKLENCTSSLETLYKKIDSY